MLHRFYPVRRPFFRDDIVVESLNGIPTPWPWKVMHALKRMPLSSIRAAKFNSRIGFAVSTPRFTAQQRRTLHQSIILKRAQRHEPSVALQELNRESASAIYDTLQKDEIRLVKLHAARNYSDPVKCSLQTVNLRSSPPFEALSYVWGKLSGQDFAANDDPFKQGVQLLKRAIENTENRAGGWDIGKIRIEGNDIQLQGEPYIITKNLNEALRRLRNESNDRILWIDALAINQSSIPERNAQVRMMLDIYATADETVVWLGGYEFAMTKLERYTNELFKLTSYLDESGLLEDDNWIEQYSTEQTKTIITAAAALAVNPYWTRAWVFQEAVASNRMVILHDKHNFSMQALTKLWKSLHRIIESTMTHLISEGVQMNMPMMQNFVMILRLPINSLQPGGLTKGPVFDANRWTEEFVSLRDCENARDKVFAAYSLFPLQVRENIKIDYALRVEDVYTDITRALINHEGPLLLLNKVDEYGHGMNFAEDTPSWVPDYDYRQREPLLRITRTLFELPDVEGETIIREDPSSLRWGFADSSRKSRILFISGYFFGTCAQISSSFTFKLPEKNEEYSAECVESWKRLGAHYDQSIKDLEVEQDHLSTFNRAFMGSFFGRHRHHIEDTALDFIISTMRDPSLFDLADNPTHQIYRLADMVNLHYRRVMFSLELGVAMTLDDSTLDAGIQYFGLGSEEMESGDEIYVVPGCDIPFICRPCGVGYKFIGFAWVSGVPSPDWFVQESGKENGTIKEISLLLV